METLADEITRLSGGRVTFDPHRRSLRRLLSDQTSADLPMTEVELRRWLQRLLFASARRPARGTDSQQLAIELLLETLDAEQHAA